MHVLITGASGFVGASLLRRLGALGVTGVAVARQKVDPLPEGWNWRERSKVLGGGELGGPVPDVMIHLEVRHHARCRTSEDVSEMWRVNVSGTAEWLRWARQHGIGRFLHFSTIKAVHAVPDGPTDESAEGPGDSIYGETKWWAERMVRNWRVENDGRSALIVRPAVVYGPNARGNIDAMISAIQRHRFFVVGGPNVKSMVSIDNLVAATVFLLDRFETGVCDTVNVVDAESLSVAQIDAELRRCLGRTGNSPTMPESLAGLLASVGDVYERTVRRDAPFNSSRLKTLRERTEFSCEKLVRMGFRHPETVHDALTKLVAWYEGTRARR